MKTWNRLVSHPQVKLKNQDQDISAAEVPPEKQGVSVPHQVPQPKGLVSGRKVPIASGCENKEKLWLSETEGFWSPRQFLLKGQGTNCLRVTCFELQQWSSSSKGTRDI